MAGTPWNTTITVDGVTLNAYSAQLGIATLDDTNGMPQMGSLAFNMDFSADMHDTKNVPFATVKKFFDLANIPTADKVKQVKIEFWADDKRTDALCTLSFQGWVSSWNISTGGGTNHVLSVSIQPKMSDKNLYDLQLGN